MNSLSALRKFALVISVYTLSGLMAANANEVQIVKVKAENHRSSWVFHVTLKHGDTGWDHYADAWRVVTEDGKELGTRTLYHPHVDEQPFTRSLGDVKISADVSVVYVEAHDKVHGWSKQRYKVKIR
ncbi:MAG: hypothetical protein P8Y28_01510 [Gammaproteobacteria bacterium]